MSLILKLPPRASIRELVRISGFCSAIPATDSLKLEGICASEESVARKQHAEHLLIHIRLDSPTSRFAQERSRCARENM